MSEFLKRAELACALGISPQEADQIGEASGARIFNPGFKCFVYDLAKVENFMLSHGTGSGTKEGEVRNKIRNAQEKSQALKARIMSNRQRKLMCRLSADDLAKINQNTKKTEVRRNGKKCN